MTHSSAATAPSVLAPDLARLGEEAQILGAAGAPVPAVGSPRYRRTETPELES